jgi:PAS domain S-box-containing protein
MEKIKVLYIDDEQSNLNAFRAAFRRVFDIHLARSADEGLQVLNTHPIEVILSDQRMPSKTGVDFFESILDKHPNPIRILLTAYTDINAIIAAINIGQVYRYVTKPWNEFDLKLTIENAYRIYHLKEQNNKVSAKYSRIFSESSDPIMLFDTMGRIVDYNKAATEALESSGEEIHFSSFISFLTNRKKGKKLFLELETKDSIVDKELEVVTNKGNVKTFLVALNTIRDFHKNVVNYQVIFKDITQRKASQKLLLKTIIETQENERERIARDLHDGLGQTLAAIKLNLDAVKNKQALSETECERVEHLLQVSTKQLREICFDASPNVLSEFGLVQGIEDLVARTQSSALTISFMYSEAFPKIYKSLEVAIYRITQEFLNNSIKHSEAKLVEISLTDNHDHIVLKLNDNGKGFVLKDMMIYSGQGLKNIKSRVSSLNGDLEITSEINKGTAFKISFPVN